MTDQETIHNNEITSAFMGLHRVNHHVNPMPGNGYCRAAHMEYHYNYNWLMRVWAKFRDLRFPEPSDQFNHSFHKSEIDRSICYGKISDAYINLLDGIKWYNSNKLNNEL